MYRQTALANLGSHWEPQRSPNGSRVVLQQGHGVLQGVTALAAALAALTEQRVYVV